MKPRKAWAATFRMAAERIAAHQLDQSWKRDWSEFICDNLSYLGWTSDHEGREFFSQLFKPEHQEGLWGGWWPTVPHDYESRILACLLAALICEREGR